MACKSMMDSSVLKMSVLEQKLTSSKWHPIMFTYIHITVDGVNVVMVLECIYLKSKGHGSTACELPN